MIRTNRAQREALARVFCRNYEYPKHPENIRTWRRQYRAFRANLRGYIGGDCVMIQFGAMWLGIEQDGYTHS